MSKETKKIIIINNYDDFPEIRTAIDLNSEKLFKYFLNKIIISTSELGVERAFLLKKLKKILIECEKYEWMKFIESSP
jgi:hypothetical protein